MANFVYNSYLGHLLSGTIDLKNDPIYVMLLSGSYNTSVGQTGHRIVSDVAAHQVTDNLFGYITGGKQLTAKQIIISNNSAIFDADDVSWTPTTITAASGAVLWRSGDQATGRHLITYIDLGLASTSNGTFSIVWNATNGIFRIYGA